MWVSTRPVCLYTVFISARCTRSGWDFKFVGNITDLVMLVHIKEEILSYTAPPPSCLTTLEI